MIAEITGPDIICGTWIKTPRGKHQSLGYLDVGSLQVPAHRERFNEKIGNSASTRDGVEIRYARILGLNIRCERAASGCQDEGHADISVQKFEIRYVIEEVFNCPDVVVARDRDRTTICVIECAGTIANSDIGIAKSRRR